MDDRHRAILAALLKEKLPMTRKQICDAIGSDYITSEWCRGLENMGYVLIRRIPRSRMLQYSLTPTGESAAARLMNAHAARLFGG